MYNKNRLKLMIALKIILIASTAFLMQSCLAEIKKKGQFNLFDDCINSFLDKIYTSKDYPTVRTSYTPTKKEIAVAHGPGRSRQLERNFFYVTTTFNEKDIIVQSTDENCWAACALMLLQHEFGSNISMSEINERYNTLSKKEKSENEIEIYRQIINSYKKAVYKKPVTQFITVNSLLRNHLLLVGFYNRIDKTGHACLVTGLYFSFVGDRRTTIAIDKIEFIDPYTGSIETTDASKLQ